MYDHEARYKDRTEQIKQNKHVTKLHYLKLISETAKKIIQKDTKKLNVNDYKQIGLKVYKKESNILATSIKKMMSTELARKQVNEALINFYTSAGLDESEAKELLKLAKDTAKEKKDVTNLLKIVEKYENAANLTQKNTFTARTTETIDYSKIGEPTKKVTKMLEITKNEAIGSDISNDLDKVNDNIQPENNET